MKTRKLKSDHLAVFCYACHGDTCSLAPHCESLGCGSGHKSTDYVLVARFAYLQEGIDYCRDGASKGVRMLLLSRIVGAQTWHYIPESLAEKAEPGDRVIEKAVVSHV